MKSISFAAALLLAGGSAFAGSSVVAYTPSQKAGHAATYINAHVVKVSPSTGTITFRSESREVVLTTEGDALSGLGRLQAGDDVLLGYRMDRRGGRSVRIVNAILPGDGLRTGEATRGTVSTFRVVTPATGVAVAAAPVVVARPVDVPVAVVPAGLDPAPTGLTAIDPTVNGAALRNDTVNFGYAAVGSLPPGSDSPFNREIPSLPGRVATGAVVTPVASAPALPQAMAVGASRDLAARDYENSVRVLSAKANEIDVSWSRYSNGCLGAAAAVPSTVKAEPVSNRDRGWFAVLTGDVQPPSDDQCRQQLNDMTRVASDWKAAMVGAEQSARAYDVLPGAMRETRQRYHVDF